MSDETEREALTKTITSVTDTWDEPLDDVHDIPQLVNALRVAGFGRVRPVEDMVERVVRVHWRPSPWLNTGQNDAIKSGYRADVRRFLETALGVQP